MRRITAANQFFLNDVIKKKKKIAYCSTHAHISNAVLGFFVMIKMKRNITLFISQINFNFNQFHIKSCLKTHPFSKAALHKKSPG